MANKRLRKCSGIVLFLSLLVVHGSSTPVSIPVGSVSDLLIQSALDSLNENSPTHHTYKSGNLISAQKLLEPPYVIYRLTLNLEPNCNSESSTCSREACAIDLRQHERGVINIQKNSMQCMYIHPQSSQDDIQQHAQEIVQEPSNAHDQETIESLDKRVVNESVQLDHEVQTVTDGNDRPFIAVRATDRNYCAGCPYELNSTLSGLAAFGEQVVQSMDDSGRSDFKHKVVGIVRVTRAVPPGSNVVQYEILLEIGETNCLRAGLSRRAECSLLTNVPMKLCLVTFEERPWQRNSRKMTRNNCTDVPATENELDGSTEPRTVSESLASSGSRGEQSTPKAASRIEIYDQIAEEGKLGTFGSSIDDFFDGVEPTMSTGSRDAESKIPITEESHTKIVLSTEEVKRKTVGFTDKIKEFDAFLEDFDLKIKPRDPQPFEHGDPVTEEMIRPEVVVRPTVERNAAASFTGRDHEVERSTRSRRSLIDTPKSERGLVRKLAEKALRTLDDIDADNKKRVILKVIDSKKETIDGTVYHVTMKVAPTECDERNKNVDGCLYGIRESAKICKVQIHTDDKRPLESAKVLQSQCFVEPPRRRETRVKRAQRPRGLVGGRTSKSTDHPDIKYYAEKGLSKFSEISKSSNEPFLIEIIEASTQVVSGMLYRIKVRLGESTCPKGTRENCELKTDSAVNDYLITVWSQPWIDRGNPDIKIELDTENELSRVRRSEQIPGGPMQKSPDDPEIRAYAEKGLRKYSEISGVSSEPFLVQITEATAQVVSGMLYKIRVRLGDSTCPRGSSENCQLRSGSPIKDYLITVWSQPWIDHGNPDIKITEETAKSDRSRRDVRRIGSTEVSSDDPVIMDYAQRALQRYSESSEATYESLLAEISEAAVQTVSGKLYKIKVKLAESNCPKGTRENCELIKDGERKDCLITVWSQPWRDNGEPEIKLKCDQKIRGRRSLRGANYSAKMLKLRKNIEQEREFERFMQKFDVEYSSEDEKTARLRVFKDNMKIIDSLRQGEQGTAEYGVTMFADLTPEEFRSKYTGLKSELRAENEIPLPMAEIPDIELPEEFDWRHYNVVTEVKNQGSCGSCWAFAVTGNVEGLYALKHGKLLSLSEQELVDCDSFDQGCNGGMPDSAYRAIESLGGLELESDYPYIGENEKCHFEKGKARVGITSGLNITSNETQMAQWLVKNGPISIGINANAMQFYMGGVSHPFKFLCRPDNLDHGVLIVGYGIHTYPIFKKKMPYWIIKNSWGPRWGEQGYYRVYRGDGTCGLNTMATSAVVAPDEFNDKLTQSQNAI